MNVRLLATAAALSVTALSGGPAQAASLSSVASFAAATQGYTYAPVVVGPLPGTGGSGAMFGIVSPGTASGTVYEVTAPAAGQTKWTTATIASFSGGTNGGYPSGGLHADAAGALYGSTAGGGTSSSICTSEGYGGCGLVFKLTPPAAGKTAWTTSVLYKFSGNADGQAPVGGLIADASGALYGTTEMGGAASACFDGCGTVFKLTPPPAGKTTWTETILYKFQGGATDGSEPYGNLAIDSAGALYGSTMGGGNTANNACGTLTADGRCGTVFKLTPPAAGKTSWTETVLHIFADGVDGSVPQGGLAVDNTGAVYGAALQGGKNNFACVQFGFSGCGLVFKLTPPPAGSTIWAKSTLWTFTGAADGASPSGLLRDKAGALWAVAGFNSAGTKSCGFYCGTIIKLTPPAAGKTAYTQSTIWSFADGADNAAPQYNMAVDGAGTLYGTTSYKSTSTAFALTGSGYSH